MYDNVSTFLFNKNNYTSGLKYIIKLNAIYKPVVSKATFRGLKHLPTLWVRMCIFCTYDFGTEAAGSSDLLEIAAQDETSLHFFEVLWRNGGGRTTHGEVV